MTRTKKVIGLGLVGLIIGLLMVPKALLHEALWSSIESSLASNGIVLRCSSPHFSLRGVSTAGCQVRYKVFGAELERAEARLVGLFPPTAHVSMRAFNEDCDVHLSRGRVDISNCGLQAELIPQLAGLGFTKGRLLLKGTIVERTPSSDPIAQSKAQRVYDINASISGSGIDHPTMTTSRLGFGTNAPMVMIPAFEDGSIEAVLAFSPEERRVEIKRVSSSLVDFSAGTFIEKVGVHDGQSSGLRGSIGMKLTPAGMTQFGPLVDAMAQSPSAQSPLAGSPTTAGGAYQLVASGTFARPSFRVLKSR